ncbi:MgtC/SapB family protein [Sphingomonas crocodyli]|uniref:Protein MgtC n=1 Tax=Sphingomonas crocodyli TaxID=1979270 RepID=A0A437M5K4_9SPHN|nr:MgtC/SapB family protein [Sphingomonas crocodyli]RVT93010.1 MgtC/SapB family protein [Sphingomonas crocodyli]
MLMHDHWLPIIIRLGVATLLGLAIGFEREWRGHDAGMRTHALVALSSAMITVSALLLSDDLYRRGTDSDPVRVVQGLAQAIGFIAGGLIFVRGGGVKNMTTATSLWMAAAVGIAGGAGQFALVVIASVMAILVLTVVGVAKRFLPLPDEEAPTVSGHVSLPNRRGSDSDTQS